MMNTEIAQRMLGNFRNFVDEGTSAGFDGEDLADELSFRMGVVEEIRKGLDLLDPTDDELTFGVTLVAAVYMSAMNQGAECAHLGDRRDEDAMNHRVYHMASTMQDLVIGLLELERMKEDAA